METLGGMQLQGKRRLAVMQKIKAAGHKGFSLFGDEPDWWPETLTGLRADGMVYTLPGPRGSETYFVGARGERVLKVVRK